MTIYGDAGSLFLNVSVFGAGALFGILALIYGASKSLSQDQEKLALTFTALCWVMALIMPKTTFAIPIFILGTIAATTVFTPLVEKMDGTNALYIGIIALIMNIVMLFAVNAFTTINTWCFYVSACVFCEYYP